MTLYMLCPTAGLYAGGDPLQVCYSLMSISEKSWDGGELPTP